MRQVRVTRALAIGFIALSALFCLGFFIAPAVGLYWLSSSDPTAGGGVGAPQYQLLIRTDTPSLYYKSGAGNTQWTKIGEPSQPFTGVTLGAHTGNVLQGNGTGGNPLTFATTGLAGTGLTPYWDGTDWQEGDYRDEPRWRWVVTDDFTAGSTTCGTAGSNFVGTGTACTISGDGTHPGLILMGTDGSGSRITLNATPNIIVFGSSTGNYCAEWNVRIPVLGASTRDFIFRVGWGEFTTLGNGTDEVAFLYDRLANGNNWFGETRSNGTSTLTNLNVAVPSNTFTRLKACVNATATSANFYINGTLAASATTNIPSGTARATSLGAQCLPNTGAQIYTCDLDWVHASAETAR